MDAVALYGGGSRGVVQHPSSVYVGGHSYDGAVNVFAKGQIPDIIYPPVATISATDRLIGITGRPLGASTENVPLWASVVAGGNGCSGILRLYPESATKVEDDQQATVVLESQSGLLLRDKTGHPVMGFGLSSGLYIGGVDAKVTLRNPQGEVTAELRGSDGHFSGAQAQVQNLLTNVLHVGGNAFPGLIHVTNANNELKLSLSGSEGDIFVSGDITLANADCAEEFDVERGEEEVEAGTVVVLNASGRLSICRQERDPRAVGVVSGAGSYRPALVLDRQPSDCGGSHNGAPRRLPVALMGKVYCKVDARHVPVAPGDLLTTSSLPGHAMALPWADRMQAVGSILGKALAGLEKGTGLVPMLVASG